jgi:hypothetical protein
METLFSEQMIRGCVASDAELTEAMWFGHKHITEGPDGMVVSYKYKDKIYITDIQIIPE